jgi:glycerol-3-phosphate acyltransferase PlsY
MVVGFVSLDFIAADVIRFLSRSSFALFFKTSEARRFSSMTYFLVAAFVSFLVFPGEIPYLTLAFASVGDLGGKLIGLRFGKTLLHKNKTLEGALGFFAASVMAAYILSRILPVPLLLAPRCFLGV